MSEVDRYITGLVNNLENLKGTLSSPANISGKLSNATLRGAAVELRIEGTVLQWKYEDKDEWMDLIDLSTLDYSTLQNLPTIDGVEIKGEIAEMIISAIQDLLDEKVDKVQGKELSTNDFTNELKSKLDDIEDNAQENVIESINVNGDSQTIDNKTVNLTIPTNLLNGSAIGSLRGVNSRTEDENYTIGRDAVAVGFSTRAVGDRAFAEGYATKALGAASHSEGYYTIASGDYSHAEGFQTKDSVGAIGTASHIEGTNTTALGTDSHAEGLGTVANHRSQHVFGQYNIADTSENSANDRGDYVEIVGNGKIYTPSNARTLDWNGNEVLAGKLTVGVAPTESMDVTTKGYVDTNISNVSDAIPTNVSDLQNDANYIDASGAPVQSVNNQTGDIVITAQSIGALTQHQDISGKADKSELSLVATSGSYNDLTNKPTIPSKVSDLTNDENYQTDADVSAAIADAISQITGFDFEIVQQLPASGEKGIIYLIAHSHGVNDGYDEYIWVVNKFERLGNLDIDLSGYLQTSNIISNAEIDQMFPT